MTSNVVRKLLVAGAVVAALGVVACKPKPAADTTAASDATAAASDAQRRGRRRCFGRLRRRHGRL